MATRNLTSVFKALRNSMGPVHRSSSVASERVRLRDEDEIMMEEGGLTVTATAPWIPVIDQIKRLTNEIQIRMTELRELHLKHLKPHFVTDERSEEMQIEEQTLEIQQQFKRCEAAVKKLEFIPRSQLSTDDARVLANVKISLVTQVTHLSKKFRDEQRRYMNERTKQKERAGKMKSIGGFDQQAEEDRNRNEQMADMVDRGFSREQVEQIMWKEDIIMQRDEELQKIYRSIVDLHEIFKDLHSLVIDQGTLLDRIDYNLENTKAQVIAANEELKKAVRYQKKSKFACCVFVMVITCIILILLLVVKYVVF